jgi:hypothetical protein
MNRQRGLAVQSAGRMTGGAMKTVREIALPLIIVAGVLGIGVGLLLGWQVWPVQWYDTDPSDLRPAHQATFVELVADSYAVTGKADIAARRLLELTDKDTSWAQVASLVESTAAERATAGDEAAALRIRRMAQAAKLPPADAEQYQPRQSGALPLTRSILMVAAIVAFVAALAMLVWVIVRLIKQRRPARDDLGRIPEGYDAEELPLASKPKAKIVWEEPVADSAPPTVATKPAVRPPATMPPAGMPAAPSLELTRPTPEPQAARPTAVPPAPSISPVAQSATEDEELEAIFAQAFQQPAAPAPGPDQTPPFLKMPESEEVAEPLDDLLDAEKDDEDEDDWATFDSELLEEIEEAPLADATNQSQPTAPPPPLITPPPARAKDLPKGALGLFEAEYQYGDDDFDCSFTIETQGGEFLGECGVGISDVLSADGGQRVNAFEVWLFDKSDIRTVSKVLVSQHTFEDPDLNAKLSAKGDLVMARQSIEIALETLTLEVTAVVTGFAYLPNDTPAMAAFARLSVEMVARQVD